MRHTAHRKQKLGFVPTRNECGVIAFGSRKQARQRSKHLPGKHVRPYRCPDCELWHLGHLPVVVLVGEVSASEWYSAKAAATGAAA